MKAKLITGLSVALISASILASPAKASCLDSGSCEWAHGHHGVHHRKHQLFNHIAYKPSHSVHQMFTAHRGQGAVPADRAPVIAMIKAQAPSYGVPTWFALRIAKIESGYNPRARGAAGEYGVFQMKCATARGVGFRGNCAGLLNASTNVRYGLKHLSLAVRGSHGNLRLAASKHNGGLGRKSLVPRYVAMVF
jgi:soluble lytic murein transglycosylase-like protein